MQNNKSKVRNVFLLVPNIVTISRLMLFLLSLVMLSMNKKPFFWLFVMLLCDLGDAVDGYLARKRNESTKVGQILDFAFDRIMVIGGTFLLCLFFPTYWFFFFLVASLDVLSHYFYLKSVYEDGKINHRATTSFFPVILKFYYKNKIILFSVCFFHDLFFCLLMLSHFIEMNIFLKIILYFSSTFAVLKTYIHVTKILFSLQTIARLEDETATKNCEAKNLAEGN